MNAKICTVLIITAFGLLVFSCEEDNNHTQLTIKGKLVSNSDCKQELKSDFGIMDTPDSLSCIDYSFDDASNILTIKHINAGFNCCPGSLHCVVSLNADTIIIQESEEQSLCNCNCLYDLTIEISGVDAKTYHVKFIEPYAGEQEKILFGIDLTKDKAGIFCVTRKLYPWHEYY